jgi:hypothetical protein
MEEKKGLSDDEASALIQSICKVQSTKELQTKDKKVRNRMLASLGNKGISDRQLSRLTGISRAVIRNARAQGD